MNTFAKFAIALAISAFAFSAPVMAADIPTPQAPAQSTPDLTGTLKEKAADIVDQAKDKADNTAEKIEDALGAKKPANPLDGAGIQKDGVTPDATKNIIPDNLKAPAVK